MRIILAGTGSAVGKTTIATGIMKALSEKYNVQPFKVGPDYIDPSYHTLATGNTSRNLDSFFMKEGQVRDSFLKGMEGKDIAVISCYIVDKDGNEVYDAENVVSFSCNELGSIYSTGSDVTDHSTLFSPIRKMRAGRIGVALKVKEKEGELKVYAKSDGLIDATLSINLKK